MNAKTKKKKSPYIRHIVSTDSMVFLLMNFLIFFLSTLFFASRSIKRLHHLFAVFNERTFHSTRTLKRYECINLRLLYICPFVISYIVIFYNGQFGWRNSAECWAFRWYVQSESDEREKKREGRRWSVKCGRKPMETSIWNEKKTLSKHSLLYDHTYITKHRSFFRIIISEWR